MLTWERPFSCTDNENSPVGKGRVFSNFDNRYTVIKTLFIGKGVLLVNEDNKRPMITNFGQYTKCCLNVSLFLNPYVNSVCKKR